MVSENKLMSVITVVKNNKVGLIKTIESVVSQEETDFEFIVIDGKSTDGTCDVINENKNLIQYFVSEMDSGISDAFNKGIRASTGKWLLFLNGGDSFFNNQVLSTMKASLIANPDVDIVHGKISFNDIHGNKIKEFGSPYKKSKFKKSDDLMHPAMFINRKYFEEYGLFDVKYKMAMDYELLLRKDTLRAVFIDSIMSNMVNGGVSMTRLNEVIDESICAIVSHKKASCWHLKCYYLLKKAKYFYFYYKNRK